MDTTDNTISDAKRFSMDPPMGQPSYSLKVLPSSIYDGHGKVSIEIASSTETKIDCVKLKFQGPEKFPVRLEQPPPAPDETSSKGDPTVSRIDGDSGDWIKIDLDWVKDAGKVNLGWLTAELKPGTYVVSAWVKFESQQGKSDDPEPIVHSYLKVKVRPVAAGDSVSVSMRRAAAAPTIDQTLWVVIRKSAEAVRFDNYDEFVKRWMCDDPRLPGQRRPRSYSSSTPFPFIDAYKRLKVASELFLMSNCGVAGHALDKIDFSDLNLSEESLRLGRPVTQEDIEKIWESYLVTVNGDSEPILHTLPYLQLARERLKEYPIRRQPPERLSHEDMVEKCYGILQEKLTNPCLLELIWSYWHEEGMLVQTMNAISMRFQNQRSRFGRDPLADLDIDPLRSLNNLLWGYIQDEQHRLTLPRRVYEYDHHYGIPLCGRAVPTLMSTDGRSKFLEGFHNLLTVTSVFYKEDDDTMVVADGFPVLRALKDVHLLLAEGAHNQFGDLPSTARTEMLMQQWLLARPEMREFLGSRIMVTYKEGWMDRVDTMKRLQGWTDTSVIHFHDLATFGEQILLSIRYGSWGDIDHPENAANWARYWRPEVQGYIHAYRAVTGVDLAGEVSDPRHAALRYLPPSVHLRNRQAVLMRRR